MSAVQNQESTLKSKTPLEVAPSRQVKVFLSWESPSRVFKRRSREFWSTLLSIAFLIGVILLFIGEWFLILVIVAAIFAYYILSTVPPERVKHQITNYGIRTAGRAYVWEELSRFWFSERFGQKILYLETLASLPGRLEILLAGQDRKKVEEILSKYLPKEKAEPSFLEKASSWLSEKIPLETPA